MNKSNRHEYFEFVEKQAKANADFGIDVAKGLKSDSVTLLNILLGAIGGSMAISIQIFTTDKISNLTIDIALLSTYFAVLAIVLVMQCIKTKPIYPPCGEPNSLMFQGYGIHNPLDLKETALKKAQERIDENRKTNKKTAEWLDYVRIGTLTSPLAFAVISACVFFLR